MNQIENAAFRTTPSPVFSVCRSNKLCIRPKASNYVPPLPRVRVDRSQLKSRIERISDLKCFASEEASSVREWKIERVSDDDNLIGYLGLVLQGYFEESFAGMFDGDNSAHVKSHVKQRLEQEIGVHKIRFQQKGDKHAESMCLVAKDTSNSEILGGVEICVCFRLSGLAPPGVPVEEEDAFYVQNLIVKPEFRRKGVGHLLVRGLIENVSDLGGSALYAHVEAPNEGALEFYKKHQFQIVREEGEAIAPGSKIGRLFLLKLELNE